MRERIKIITFSLQTVLLLATIEFFIFGKPLFLETKAQASPICETVNGNCYYVSPNGDDANDGSFGSPWKTVKKAWLSAGPGDVVYFREGVYYVNSTIRNKFEGHDGTPEKPITFTSYPEEKAIIDGSYLPDSDTAIFNHERNYYVIKNLYFRNAQRGFFVGEDTKAVGNKFINNVWTTDKGGDNVGFVVLQGTDADNTLIANNIIKGPVDFSNPTQKVHGNTAGIVAFSSTNLKIFNNEISHVPIGIYFKHANKHQDDNNEIAYNYIHDTTRNAMQINCNYCRIHDNILGSNNKPVLVNEANGKPGGDFNIIEHNTFYKTALVLSGDTQSGDNYPGAQGNTLRNNIFTESTRIHVYRPGRAHNTVMDYNLYPTGEAVREYSDYNTYTLSQWRSHYGQDDHSVSGNPIFIGGSNPSRVSGFALAPNSPGKNAASDGKDMGADVSLVGTKDNFIPYTCGNGIIEPGEQCDDGNTTSGDGCFSTCQLETSTKTPDLNSDNKVDVFDLITLLNKWNTNDISADLNSSGKVDVFDLLILLQNWGSTN
jgi:cysteine-rich repeat protein